jgi:hypothetical protein
VPNVAVETCSPTAAAENSSNSATVTTATVQAAATRAIDASSNNKLRALVTSAWQRTHGLSAEGNMHCVDCTGM